LLETSVLERLTGELCDAVTGRPGSQAMLEQIERAGLFLICWMRCVAGGATTTCSPTCCAHALAAGDTEWAAGLVERHVETLLGRSERVTLRRWLSALPTESVRGRPRLCLAQAYGAAQGFQTEALEALLDDAERAFAVSGDEPYENLAGRPVSVLANVPAGSRSCAPRAAAR
jgi:LuxR family maltose regulon positive regulatory protein